MINFNHIILNKYFNNYNNSVFLAEKSQGMAVERIIELVTHKTIYPEILLQVHFVAENCPRLISTLTSLEATSDPLAVTCYNHMEDLRAYLQDGASKDSFGTETDKLLSKLKGQQLNQTRKSLNSVFSKSLEKFEKHFDQHPGKEFYKAVRAFDPRNLPSLPHGITQYEAVPGIKNAGPELRDEWAAYCQINPDDYKFPDAVSGLPAFWRGLATRFPLLSSVAEDAIWMPVASVDVERSFSQYKHLLNDRRTSLTEANTKQLVMLYYNGDIEKRF
jgi:hypothetical protein